MAGFMVGAFTVKMPFQECCNGILVAFWQLGALPQLSVNGSDTAYTVVPVEREATGDKLKLLLIPSDLDRRLRHEHPAVRSLAMTEIPEKASRVKLSPDGNHSKVSPGWE
jgi:hypothetical protein